MSTSLPSLVLHTAHVNAIAHAQQTSKMTAIMKSTAQMLQEIQCGTAAEIILDSRAVNHPFGPTWLTKLDNGLKRARPHAGESSLERGDLVEISGPSGSGKTTMLLFLLMTSILPSQYTFHYPNPIRLDLGGRDQYASFLYPTTHPSPIPILRRRLYEYVERAIISQVGQIAMKPELVSQIDQLVKESLGRLRVMRVKPRYKTWSLALKSLLYQKEGGMDLVVCDGFSDGFWPERCNDEKNKGKGKRVGVRGSDDIGMQDVMEDFKRLRKDLGAVVVLSVQGLWTSGQFDSTHLPPPYPNPFSHDADNPHQSASSSQYPLNIQIALHGRRKALQEPPDRTLIEALYIRDATYERPARKFEGVVRVVNGVDGAGGHSGARFEWTVGDQGVHVWEDQE